MGENNVTVKLKFPADLYGFAEYIARLCSDICGEDFTAIRDISGIHPCGKKAYAFGDEGPVVIIRLNTMRQSTYYSVSIHSEDIQKGYLLISQLEKICEA